MLASLIKNDMGKQAGDFAKYFTSTIRAKKFHFNVQQRRPPVVDTVVASLFITMEKIAKEKNVEVGNLWRWDAVVKFVSSKLESEFAKGKDGQLTLITKDLDDNEVTTFLSMDKVMTDLANVRVFSTGMDAKTYMSSPATASCKGEPLTLRLLLAYIVKTTKKMCENDAAKKAIAFGKPVINADLLGDEVNANNDDNGDNDRTTPSHPNGGTTLVVSSGSGSLKAGSKKAGTKKAEVDVPKYPKELYNKPNEVTLALTLETGDEVCAIWTNPSNHEDEGTMSDMDSLYGGLAYCSQNGGKPVDPTKSSRDRLQVDVAFQDGDSQINAKLSQVCLKLNENYYDIAKVTHKLKMLREIHEGNEAFTKEVDIALTGKDLPLLKSLLIRGIELVPPVTATTPTSIRALRKKRSGPAWKAVQKKSSSEEKEDEGDYEKKGRGSKKRVRKANKGEGASKGVSSKRDSKRRKILPDTDRTSGAEDDSDPEEEEGTNKGGGGEVVVSSSEDDEEKYDDEDDDDGEGDRGQGD
jgi:hypothetical protein